MTHVKTFCRDPLLTIANHLGTLVVAFIGLVLLSACAFSVLEPWSFGESVYWAITTATTTGYGDISPKSGLGMALANTIQVSGLILGAFLVANVLDRLRKNEHILTDAEQDWNATVLTRIAEELNINVEPYPDSNGEC